MAVPPDSVIPRTSRSAGPVAVPPPAPDPPRAVAPRARAGPAEVVDQHRRALGGVHRGNGGSDTATTPGHNGHSVLEPITHGCFSLVVGYGNPFHGALRPAPARLARGSTRR